MSKLFLLLCFLFRGALGARGNCEAKNYKDVQNAPEDMLIYGITQDCQMFFIRPSQLHLLNTIRIDRRHSFCYANLVQLHLKSHDTLLLTFKQAKNRICTLEVHIPTMSMLFGDHLFRYSLLNSLPYASCSHSKDTSFQLEPDLSFMDPLYSDVIYFIDALSTGSNWKIHQFLLKDTGNLSMMNNLTVNLQSKDSSANEFLVSIDNQRDKLYRRNKFDNLIYQQCAFEMLFRPKESEVNSFETPSRGYGTILNGQSIDGNTMIYVETDRTTDPPTNRLNMMSTEQPENVVCLSSISFSFDVGIISEKTMETLKNQPIPPFGTKVTGRPSFQNDQTVTSRNQFRISTSSRKSSISTTTPLPSTSTSSVTTTSTSSKPKVAYSPSKSFFSYEMGATATTTTAEVVMSNEIPVEKIKQEQEEEEEEELNEIIKELKTDEDDEKEGVGELRTRTRDLTTSEGVTEIPEDVLSLNDTSSDAEAVKSSHSQNYFCLVAFLSIILLI